MMGNIHCNRVLITKMIQGWHRFASLQAYKRAQTRELLATASAQLKALKLASCWYRWRQEQRKAQEVSDQLEVARSHHNKFILFKALQYWKVYTKTYLRERLLSRQSLWFNNVRLTAKCFLTWRKRLQQQREENSKTHLALWQWSLSLQRKVLLAWIWYKDERKHIKKRLVEASSIRRQRLLRIACCQWLTTADSLSQVRLSMAARYQAKTVIDSFQLVQKCALHWKAWAHKRNHRRKQNLTTDDKTLSVPFAAKTRTEAKLLQSSITTNIYPNASQMMRSITTSIETVKPQVSRKSPVQKASSVAPDSQSGITFKHRPLPKRPQFLVESLQRAGLYSHMLSRADQNDENERQSEMSSSPSITDPLVIESHEYPSTGRFEPHIMPTSQWSKLSLKDLDREADSSFSAEVLSGSNSTLVPSSHVLNPLHLSNTDTEYSSTQTASSCSPPMFTPSTQRSQFSGNPLFYSSPISDSSGTKPEIRTTDVGTAFAITETEGKVIGRNVLGGDSHGLQSLEMWQENQQQQVYQQPQRWESHGETKSKKGSIQEVDTFVLLKPEDFLKKSVQVEKSKRRSSDGSTGQRVKNTSHAFSVSELGIESGQGMLNGNTEYSREGKGVLRCTPREVVSPRQAAPQGILHTKVSDSDGGVSPLNTARSHGTVTFASPKSLSPEEEIMSIRDRLRHFSQQKQKLRSLQKQYNQLAEWLQGQSTKREDDDNEDSQSVSEELDMLRLEVAQLQAFVDGQKPFCEQLVLRAQTLAAELNIAF